MIPVSELILAVAGAGLPGAPTLAGYWWGDRIDEVVDQGLAGLLASSAAAGRASIDGVAAETLQRRLDLEAIRAVQLEGELIRLSALLERLPAVVLKGAVLAHGAYPDPLLRPFTDLDLLVTGERFPSAVEALSELGYARSRPEPAPGFDAQVGKALTLTHPGGVVVDLHRTLAAGRPGAAVDVEQILATRIAVPVGPITVPAPSWEAHLVECALHAVVGDGLARGLSIRDVAQVAALPELDPEGAVDLARRWQVADELATALHAAERWLGATLPATLTELAWQARTTAPPPGRRRSARSRLDELRHGDLRQRAILARALVAPSPEFLRWTYGTGSLPQLYGRRWRDLLQRVSDASLVDPTEAPPAPESGHAGEADRTTSPGPEAPQETSDSPWVDPPPSLDPAPALEPLPAPPPLPSPPTMPTPARSTAALVAPDSDEVDDVAPPPDRRVPGPRERRGPHPALARSAPRRPSGGRQERWTSARPPRRAGPGRAEDQATDDPGDGPPGSGDGTDPPATSRDPLGVAVTPDARSGVPWALAGGGLLATTAVGAQLGQPNLGVVLVPVAALMLAVAAGRRVAQVRPDEAWVGRWLLLGVAAKITASYLRYLTLVVGYEGVGDATGYDGFGRQFAAAWLGDGTAPDLENLRRTNFLRWFTGVVYYLFGSNMVAGYFVFGLLALIGSYLWFRAASIAVPTLNKKLFLGLMLFAPSIAFWPSSIGKESLMQLGIGVVALGTAHLLHQRLLTGLVVGLAGGWLLWVVRPHLLALVTVAAGLAYMVGRVGRGEGRPSLIGRPVGLLVVVLLMAFTISQGAEFLGIDDLSLSSIEAELDEQTERSAQGGSEFDNGGNSLSPLRLPQGAATVLLRPFPWETDTPFQLLSSLESMLLAALIVTRFSSIRASLTRARATPFLLYCWVLTILYAATFSSFANFGLLVRQRSLVLPALFVLLALDVARDRRPDVAPVPRRVLVGAGGARG